MKVLITGGSGLIGSALTNKLVDEGHEVVHLTRYPNSKNGVKTYVWDYKKNKIDYRCFDGVTHIVHLAGEGIADKPWTMERKRAIVKSRVLTTRLLEKHIREKKLPIKAFISASGIGYYGAITTDHLYCETDEPYTDFVGECCVQWEDAVLKLNDYCRVSILRTGIVLSSKGGAIEKMASPIKKRIGAPLGKGNQYMPWIHLDDMVAMYCWMLNNELSGIFNATSSVHTTNKEFTLELAKALNKKIFLPNVPEFVIKWMFGEMADILLYGSKVSNEKIKSTGYTFTYDNLEEALSSLQLK
jgi:uncharacterized protein (TIGR01777 family)